MLRLSGNAGAKELFELDSIERLSMACPALPLCGLAIGEAERSIPDVNRRLRALLDRLGLPESTTVSRTAAGAPCSDRAELRGSAGRVRRCQ